MLLLISKSYQTGLDMNIMQLRCFLAVADTLSFARAAEMMNVTQPAITQQIQTLEEELGVKLFRRSTRSVEITNEGRIFFGDAANIIERVDKAINRFKDEDIRRNLIIGTHRPFEILGLSEALKTLHSAYPSIYPVFRTIPFLHIFRSLAEGKLDAVISFEDITPKKDIAYKEIEKLRVMALVSKANPLSRKRAISIEDLAKERLILIEPMHCPASLNHVQQKIAEGHSAHDIYIADCPEASTVLAESGFGIAIQLESRMNRKTDLSQIPIAGMAEQSFGIYYREPASDELDMFISLLTEKKESKWSQKR